MLGCEPQLRFPRCLKLNRPQVDLWQEVRIKHRSQLDGVCANGKGAAMGGGRTMWSVGAPTPLALQKKNTNETTANNTVTRDTHTTHRHTQ